MIDKKNIKRMVDHILHPEKKKFIDNNIMHPEREWLVGVLIGIIICVFGIFWGLYTFNFYKNIEPNNLNEVEAESVIFRESLVKKSLQDFEQREKIYNELLLKNKLSEDERLQKSRIENATDTPAVVGVDLGEVTNYGLQIKETSVENSTSTENDGGETNIEDFVNQ